MILRLDITKVNCKRFEFDLPPGVKVMTTAEPTSVQKKKIGNRDFLMIDFAWRTKYEPKAGELEIVGTAFYTDDDLESKYEKDKKGDLKIMPLVTAEVAHAIFNGPAAIIAVNMARELNLPMPIQFPKVDVAPDAAKAQAK